MPTDEDYPDWIRKRRYPFFRGGWDFEDIDKMFREMEKTMEEEFKTFTSRVPKDYVRERKLPDGSTVRELGPFVYGYSVKIGRSIDRICQHNIRDHRGKNPYRLWRVHS